LNIIKLKLIISSDSCLRNNFIELKNEIIFLFRILALRMNRFEGITINDIKGKKLIRGGIYNFVKN